MISERLFASVSAIAVMGAISLGAAYAQSPGDLSATDFSGLPSGVKTQFSLPDPTGGAPESSTSSQTSSTPGNPSIGDHNVILGSSLPGAPGAGSSSSTSGIPSAKDAIAEATKGLPNAKDLVAKATKNLPGADAAASPGDPGAASGDAGAAPGDLSTTGDLTSGATPGGAPGEINFGDISLTPDSVSLGNDLKITDGEITYGDVKISEDGIAVGDTSIGKDGIDVGSFHLANDGTMSFDNGSSTADGSSPAGDTTSSPGDVASGTDASGGSGPGSDTSGQGTSPGDVASSDTGSESDPSGSSTDTPGSVTGDPSNPTDTSGGITGDPSNPSDKPTDTADSGSTSTDTGTDPSTGLPTADQVNVSAEGTCDKQQLAATEAEMRALCTQVSQIGALASDPSNSCKGWTKPDTKGNLAKGELNKLDCHLTFAFSNVPEGGNTPDNSSGTVEQGGSGTGTAGPTSSVPTGADTTSTSDTTTPGAGDAAVPAGDAAVPAGDTALSGDQSASAGSTDTSATPDGTMLASAAPASDVGSSTSVPATGDYVENFNSLDGWTLGDRWMQDNGPGYIDFANPGLLDTSLKTPPAGYEPASIDNGILTLTARRAKDDPAMNDIFNKLEVAQNADPSGSLDWQGAQIAAKNFDVVPGDYVETRMKVTPWEKGVNAAFWLYDSKSGGTQELDAIEAVGDGNGNAGTNLHDGKNTGAGDATLPLKVDLSQWHTYGVKYDTGKITTYIDGKPVGTLTGPAADKFTGPMHVIFGVGGGAYGIEPSTNKIQMQVDYVKVNHGGGPNSTT